VNANEPLMRLRYELGCRNHGCYGNVGSPHCGFTTAAWLENPSCFKRGHHDPGVERAPSSTASHSCETWQPRWGPTPSSGKPIARTAQLPSGHRTVQEAKASNAPMRRIFLSAITNLLRLRSSRGRVMAPHRIVIAYFATPDWCWPVFRRTVRVVNCRTGSS
jgi:hypothetical protein